MARRTTHDPGSNSVDGPVAHGLPDWDLEPVGELMIRRRSSPARAPVGDDPAPVATARRPMIETSSPVPAEVPASDPAVTQDPVSAQSRQCKACGAPLEDGAGFCSDCGAAKS